jgi:hypothetical protein
VTRSSTTRPDEPARVVRCNVNITNAQDEALTREAKSLGIPRNELLRRVLDDWRDRLTKKAST